MIPLSIIIKYRYLWFFIGASVFTTGAYVYGYYKGKSEAESIIAVAALERQSVGLLERKEVEHEVQNMDRAATIGGLHDRGELRHTDDY